MFKIDNKESLEIIERFCDDVLYDIMVDILIESLGAYFNYKETIYQVYGLKIDLPERYKQKIGKKMEELHQLGYKGLIFKEGSLEMIQSGLSLVQTSTGNQYKIPLTKLFKNLGKRKIDDGKYVLEITGDTEADKILKQLVGDFMTAINGDDVIMNHIRNYVISDEYSTKLQERVKNEIRSISSKNIK